MTKSPTSENLTVAKMKAALTTLDRLLVVSPTVSDEISLIVGGGGAMILAHGFPLATDDIDAVARGIDAAALDPFVKQVAQELGIAPDWLNPYFYTFAHTLPSDYGTRLIEVFRGKRLKALALGKEEMLVMKCFAHRQKDVGHAKSLIKKGANVEFVESHLEALKKKGIPGTQAALDFLDDVRDQLEGS